MLSNHIQMSASTQFVGRHIKYYNNYIYGYWGLNFVERYTSEGLSVAGRYNTNQNDIKLFFIDANAEYLFAAGYPEIIFQWNLETQELVNIFKIPKIEELEIVAIKVYKQFLFVASEMIVEEGYVDVWDFTTGDKIRTIQYTPYGETTIQASKDILYVVTGKRCNMYDINSGERLKKINLTAEVYIHPIKIQDPDTVYFCTNSPITITAYNHSTSTFKYIVIDFKARMISIHENYIYFCQNKTLYVAKMSLSENVDVANRQSYRNDPKEVIRMQKNIDAFAIGANKIFIQIGNTVQTIEIPNFASNYEEDSDAFTNYHTDADSVSLTSTDGYEGSVSKCLDQNLIMLEPYTTEDNPILFYLPNSKGKFGNPNCTTKEELEQYFKTFIGNAVPDNIMTIYTSPSFPSPSGHGSEPTGKIVVKLPMNNIYVTLGSIKRVMHSDNRQWYAQALFSGKRRRVGNLKGLFAASMNHGQVPGFLIYKLYTKEEILSNIEVKEDNDDYPLFFVESAKELYELLGYKDVTPEFTDKIINMIIDTI
ncbi:MAG: hypothetical protein EBU90_04900 [Proteobacteria bacterium]|nr:hypothetical protein [Pseudomonadota bacterium]NBP13743.1 hypothetical protein [bacterium]